MDQESIQARLLRHIEKEKITGYQLWKELSKRSPTKLHQSVVYGWLHGKKPHEHNWLTIQEYLRGRG